MIQELAKPSFDVTRKGKELEPKAFQNLPGASMSNKYPFIASMLIKTFH
jgi:hypothetical protein